MSADRLLTLIEATAMLGVHDDTVRRWGDAGTLPMVRTPGGHRRFPLSGVEAFLGNNPSPSVTDKTPRVAVYCRVSSHDQKQKGDLERQVGRMSAHCVRSQYLVVDILEDIGSGMSDNRPKLLKLFSLVNTEKIDRVVIEHKDRLSRFNFGFLEAYFKSHGVTIEWTNEVLGKTYEAELVEDILSLMASFSARIYGKRRTSFVICITVGRKPLSMSGVCLNLLQNGCGALNIENTRIGVSGAKGKIDLITRPPSERMKVCGGGAQLNYKCTQIFLNKGRYPSNLLLDCSTDIDVPVFFYTLSNVPRNGMT